LAGNYLIKKRYKVCKANLDKLTNYIDMHLNERRLLSEWYEEINSLRVNGRRLTQRELAFAFRLIKNKNLFNVIREERNYCFVSNESV